MLARISPAPIFVISQAGNTAEAETVTLRLLGNPVKIPRIVAVVKVWHDPIVRMREGTMPTTVDVGRMCKRDKIDLGFIPRWISSPGAGDEEGGERGNGVGERRSGVGQFSLSLNYNFHFMPRQPVQSNFRGMRDELA